MLRQAESHEKKKKNRKITQTISSCVIPSIIRSKIYRNVYVPGSCFIRSDHFLVPFLLRFLFFSILFLSFTSPSRPHLCAPCFISFSLLHLFLSRESTIFLPLSLSISLLFPLFPALFHSAYTLATRALRVSGRVYSRIELSFLTYLPPNATVRFLLESFHQLFCQSQFRSSLRALPFFPRASAIVPVPRPFRSLSFSLPFSLFLFSLLLFHPETSPRESSHLRGFSRNIHDFATRALSPYFFFCSLYQNNTYAYVVRVRFSSDNREYQSVIL